MARFTRADVGMGHVVITHSVERNRGWPGIFVGVVGSKYMGILCHLYGLFNYLNFWFLLKKIKIQTSLSLIKN